MQPRSRRPNQHHGNQRHDHRPDAGIDHAAAQLGLIPALLLGQVSLKVTGTDHKGRPHQRQQLDLNTTRLRNKTLRRLYQVGPGKGQVQQKREQHQRHKSHHQLFDGRVQVFEEQQERNREHVESDDGTPPVPP